MKLSIVQTKMGMDSPHYEVLCEGRGVVAHVDLADADHFWVVCLPDKTLLGKISISAPNPADAVYSIVRAYYEPGIRAADDAAYYAALTEA